MRRYAPGIRWTLGLLVLACAPALVAQPSVELKVNSREQHAGEAFTVAIEITNFQSCEPPKLPELANATVRDLGGASDFEQTSIINGRVTHSRSRTYSFEVTPTAVGELVIPAVPVTVDGQAFRTRPVTLTVRPSDAGQLCLADIVTGRSRLYVGQRVPITLTLWIKPARYGNQILDAGTMLRQIRPIEFGPFPLQISNDPRRARPRPGGDPQELFYAYEFTIQFVAERPGPLTFDNIEIGVDYPTRGGIRNLRIRPTIESVEVLPVPMEGRPADFNGAVGLFDIQVGAQPRTVRVGDPIEVTVDLLGEGPVETLPPPLLSSNAALVEGFRLPTELLTGEVFEGRRRFRFTVRAKRDDVREIPSIAYPYFDPDAERFVVARSKPIALEVLPSAEVSAPDVAVPRAPTPAPDATNLQALDGLRDVETSELALLSNPAIITPRAVAIAAFAPPAIAFAAWAGLVFVQCRSADPARLRRRAALRTARRRIDQARSYAGPALASEITAALAGYLADRFNEPPARFAGAAALEFLQGCGVRTQLLAQWSAVIQRCEEAAFAGAAPAAGDELCTQAVACLRALERERL